MTDAQRRHFTRIPFDTQCRLISLDNSQSWMAEVVDLSLHGVLMKCPENLSVSRGNELKLELSLNDDELIIAMEAKVAHKHEDIIGFECEHIDLESMSHLRRILELNLGDPKLVEREIGEIIEVNTH